MANSWVDNLQRGDVFDIAFFVDADMTGAGETLHDLAHQKYGDYTPVSKATVLDCVPADDGFADIAIAVDGEDDYTGETIRMEFDIALPNAERVAILSR